MSLLLLEIVSSGGAAAAYLLGRTRIMDRLPSLFKKKKEEEKKEPPKKKENPKPENKCDHFFGGPNDTCLFCGCNAGDDHKTKVVKWLRIPNGYGDYNKRRYECPKCNWTSIYEDVDDFKICSCNQYLKEHFHYACSVCKFTAIMKTADDKEE